ncbi:glycoside hydrolase family 70 protein, partial [Liquorilactobacillus aquaticus]|uniref:glycoside hydrolase family 70 protein n=1 Tax=Liquorilactobacillus aquaticus TaxID=392566 RepID=UPI000708C34C
MSEQKIHYKMYKKGKNWIFAVLAVSTFSIGVAGTTDNIKAASSGADTATSVSQDNSRESKGNQSSSKPNAVAETSTSSTSNTVQSTKQGKENTQNIETTSAKEVSSSSVSNKNTYNNDTNAAKSSSSSSQSSSPIEKDDSKSQSTSSETVSESSTTIAEPSVDDTTTNVQGGKYVNNNDTWTYLDQNGNLLKGLKKVDGNIQYFNPQTGAQIKGEYVSANSKVYYFDKNTGNATAYTLESNGVTKAYTADGNEVNSGFFIDQNGNEYYFIGSGQYAVGIKEVAGNTYNFDQNGHLLKNVTKTIDGALYYFDSETGKGKKLPEKALQETSSAKEVEEYAAHNTAATYDEKSFENVNGYINADSWYRPRDIFQNGENWVASTQNDFRPILMAWWPSKSVQADYLNYMKTKGLIKTDHQFSDKDSSLVLNDAVEQAQTAMEHAIMVAGNTNWLRILMSSFVKEEAIWNSSSEDVKYAGLQLQGGFLAYQNSDLTPWANSDYRQLGITPGYLIGKSGKDAEFLLANDIDNSNPVVQAEQLNWLYYLTNFGSITANDDQANFDGIRVDAVDNVDADLLKIAADYFNAAYGLNQNDATANKHLSILEDWGLSDPEYISQKGSSQLTMDEYMAAQLNYSLTNAPGHNDKMARFIQWCLVNRSVDNTENIAVPNYSFVRAHDSNSQDQIRQAIKDATGGEYGKFTWEDLKVGLEKFYQDQNSTVKVYNKYNIPSAYAMLLTNKDTVPRIYYGDMYREGGQYLSQETIYYNTITNLLKTRVKYVAGGQTMSVDQHDILTSVRFGNGAMNVSDQGNAATRSQGIGVIVGNDPSLKLGNNEKVILHMGAAHRNQAFRAVVLTTSSGLKNYENDSDAPIIYTDSNGDLVFTNQNLVINGVTELNTSIQGVANPEVSGYLAVWVPVGADEAQSAKTEASTDASTDGKVFHSNSALDSNVLFEGFSNFVAYPESHEENANVVIAENANFFKSLGITSFELAPQYRSSGDGSFLDSTIDNGYAFTDRYDLGFGTPTKYGTVDDLRTAIKALHQAGIQAIADWVPDQLYSLSGQETVTVTRTDDHGNPYSDSKIKNTLYVANTIGGGEYQAKYGGEFLTLLKQKYPELFSETQASTGKPIDASTKIKSWSAKYLNGTNILGRGADYVLKSTDADKYFFVGDGENVFLPQVLVLKNDQQKYAAGDKSQSRFFVENHDSNKWYLIDPMTGEKQTGFQYMVDQNKTVYYNNAGQMQYGQQHVNGHWYLFDNNTGAMKTGFQRIKNQSKTVYY